MGSLTRIADDAFRRKACTHNHVGVDTPSEANNVKTANNFMKYLSWLRLFILITSLYSPLHAQHGDKIRKISWRCRGGPGLMALARPLFGKSRRWNNPA